jgi:Leucine-rich repeat (LRR) protein
LEALYKATSGNNWINDDNWLSDKPVCEWYGVTCNENGYVIELNLADNNLTGEILSEIQSLRFLQRLYLSRNYLTSLPPEVGQLSSLQVLDLWNNNFTSLPPGLTFLPLHSLSLDEALLGEFSCLYLMSIETNSAAPVGMSDSTVERYCEGPNITYWRLYANDIDALEVEMLYFEVPVFARMSSDIPRSGNPTQDIIVALELGLGYCQMLWMEHLRQRSSQAQSHEVNLIH